MVLCVMQAARIEELSDIHEKLQNREGEVDTLKKQLTIAKLHSSKKMSFMPDIMSPGDASPVLQEKPKKVGRATKYTPVYFCDKQFCILFSLTGTAGHS